MKEEVKEVEKKKKLSKYEKRKLKRKKIEELEAKKGIPKFWTTHIVETLYIFIVELIVKWLLGSLSTDWTILRIFISSCILSLIISLLTTNMNNKVRKVFLIIFNFFIAFYAWLQMGFMDFLGAFMSIGNAEQGTKITDYIFDFLRSYNLKTHLLYVPFILTIVYLIFERNITRDGYNKKIEFKNIIKDIALVVYLVLLCDLFYMTLELSFMQNKYQTISNKQLFKYPSNPSMTIKNFGTTVYFILDVKGTAFGGSEAVYASNNYKEKEESLTRDIDDTAWENLIKIETISL